MAALATHDCMAWAFSEPTWNRDVGDVTSLLCGNEASYWDELVVLAYSDFELGERLGVMFAPDAQSFSVPDLESKDPACDRSADGSLVSSLRLRARSRLTRDLERVGLELPGWWEDLPGESPANRALAWLEAHLMDSGAKVCGTADIVACGEGGDRSLTGVRVLFSSEEGTRWLWVMPELLAHLYTVRLFRPMSESLLGSLRAKARLWAKEVGLSVESLARVLAGTLVLAMLPVPDEVVALGALRGSAGQWSTEVLGALSKGQLKSTTRGGSWWDVLRPSLRFGGTKGTFLGGSGCEPLRLLA